MIRKKRFAVITFEVYAASSIERVLGNGRIYAISFDLKLSTIMYTDIIDYPNNVTFQLRNHQAILNNSFMQFLYNHKRFDNIVVNYF